VASLFKKVIKKNYNGLPECNQEEAVYGIGSCQCIANGIEA